MTYDRVWFGVMVFSFAAATYLGVIGLWLNGSTQEAAELAMSGGRVFAWFGVVALAVMVAELLGGAYNYWKGDSDE